jgi:hypothetical protein
MSRIKFMQGDVQGRSLSSLPKGAKRITNKPIALGEFSGHQHVLTGEVELFEFEGKVFAVVGSDGARLQHVHESNFKLKDYKSTKELPMADHKSHLLPEGVYEFFIQNSYNPYKKLMEKVID